MILVDSGLIALNYIRYTVANLTGIPEKGIWKNGHFYFPRPVSWILLKKKKSALSLLCCIAVGPGKVKT